MHERVKVIDATKLDLETALQIELQNRNKEIARQEEEQRIKWERDQRDNKRKLAINTLLQELQEQRQLRAKDVLQELKKKGVKAIGKEKIVDIERKEAEDLDYETILGEF